MPDDLEPLPARVLTGPDSHPAVLAAGLLTRIRAEAFMMLAVPSR